MYRWDTKKLVNEIIRQVPQITKIQVDDPGGDVDTHNIYMEIDGTNGEALFCCGFSTDPTFMDIDYDKKDVIDVEMVQLTDGMDSSGGLNSSDPITAGAFIKVRQILLDDGANVVDQLKDYF